MRVHNAVKIKDEKQQKKTIDTLFIFLKIKVDLNENVRQRDPKDRNASE